MKELLSWHRHGHYHDGLMEFHASAYSWFKALDY